MHAHTHTHTHEILWWNQQWLTKTERTEMKYFLVLFIYLELV